MTMFPILGTRAVDDVLGFYTDTVGAELLSQDPFGAMLIHNKQAFRISVDPNFEPAPRSVLGWLVEDIDGRMDELTAKGVTFERYEMLEQDERGVWTTPDGGARICWFLDPAGNILSLLQVRR